jgi:prepilin-type N-terminal cleavage/methylation domain-containing protein
MTSFRRPAYTLIELLIVVALLGLASALVMPHMVNKDIMTAEAAVRQLISDLSFAQSDALAHQEFRRVHFFDDGSGYCIVRIGEAQFDDAFDPATADYVDDPLSSAGSNRDYIVDYTIDDRWEGVVIEAVDLDAGKRFVTYEALGGTVRSGGIPGTGGTITLKYDLATYEITVAPFTGKLTVTKTG